MSTDSMQAALRRVAGAFDVRPEKAELPPGFVERATRRGRPATLTLGDIGRQLVFLGRRATPDPDATAAELAREALSLVPDAARPACDMVVPAWLDDAGTAFVAAFAVGHGSGAAELRGTSWTDPQRWPEPMPDLQAEPRTNLDAELRRLHDAVANRGTIEDPDTALDRAVRLVELVVEIQGGGEPVRAVDRPAVAEPDRSWALWLQRYETAVREEWRRARGEAAPASPPGAEVVGSLTGIRIFVSYARPDMASLAQPVRDALLRTGAAVWIDLTAPPPPDVLDAGLAETISGCDAFVLCATDEFFERAGYATQELAWAIERMAAGGPLRRALAVRRPGTLLPDAIAHWPIVEFEDKPGLAALLAARLTATPPAPVPARPASSRPAQVIDAVATADRSQLVQRARHLLRFDEINQSDSYTRLVTGTAENRQVQQLRRRLLAVGDGLDWSGRLVDEESWPVDPVLRDLRWRLGVHRIVGTVRWPLTGDLARPLDVADDLDRMLLRPLPVLDWPTGVGWADEERRLAVRAHAGELRVLEQLLLRELTGGLAVDGRRLQRWASAVSGRRQECVDALVELRLGHRVGWRADPPTWDRTFRELSAWLRSDAHGRWNGSVPDDVMFTVLTDVEVLAAAAADTAWIVSRQGGSSARWFPARGRGTGLLEVHAGPEVPIADGRVIQLGLLPGTDGAELRLGWSGFGPDGTGAVRAVGPHPLRQAISADSC